MLWPFIVPTAAKDQGWYRTAIKRASTSGEFFDIRALAELIDLSWLPDTYLVHAPHLFMLGAGRAAWYDCDAYPTVMVDAISGSADSAVGKPGGFEVYTHARVSVIRRTMGLDCAPDRTGGSK